jgi:dihydroorotase
LFSVCLWFGLKINRYPFMKTILIRNAHLINEGKIEQKDLFIRNGRIERIDNQINTNAAIEYDATGKHVIPGIIDDQVHFREPGLTHKATIQSEARAAVAGGVTSFMEMPNVNPPSVTQPLLEAKYQIGAKTALANYSFFMGATNDNLDEVLRTNPRQVCGVKVFMGSSTGNMLVDNEKTLENLFAKCPMLIATHCEDEATIRENTQIFKQREQTNGDFKVTAEHHPVIRNAASCLKSAQMAIELAQKHNTRLHILHISTQDELKLFKSAPISEKRITAEVCVHHLYYNADSYAQLGNLIKCNPAIKGKEHQTALFKALLNNQLDIIATDHAPHTWAEKAQPYWNAPSGLPLVQHGLLLMLSFYHQGMISMEKIVEKMCHAPAECFKIEKRGYIREGYWADLAILDLQKTQVIHKKNIAYQCGWSPLEGETMQGKVEATIVSGHLAYRNGIWDASQMGQRLYFTN